MKRLFIIILFALTTQAYGASQNPEKKVLELKNGATVTGYVMRQDDGSYLLETETGDIIFYTQNEVKGIRSLESLNNTSNPTVNTGIAGAFSLESLLELYGIKDKLQRYEKAWLTRNKEEYKSIEDELWGIEKTVGRDESIPIELRREFENYIESQEDAIEKAAKRKRRRL